MMTTPRNILMTMALPYANGEIHLGHMVEAIQADIWGRFQKMGGNTCLFICGSDAHGTGVMLAAEKRGMTPDELVAMVHDDHLGDYQQFLIEFDHFYTTHSDENKALASTIYKCLQARGDITTKTITQAFDPEKNIFLADRFIKGECPRCHATDQYGDSCEVCGATYSPMELIHPVSVFSGVKPIEKESLHYFFELKRYQEVLQQWLQQDRLPTQMQNKLQEWFKEGLRRWDISRDAPYFGFEIPGAPGKYFYVWLDAPIGYMASLKAYCAHHPEFKFEDYWAANSNTELHHFIGKDIVYFHSLFWPAMLHGAGYRLPTAIHVHGFLTINGAKMSKSRGTFMTAKQYLKHFPPEALRYYFAAKLTADVQDIDLNLEDFCTRVNADLVNKFVNLASRSAGFITKKFGGQLANTLHDEALFQQFVNKSDEIAECYDTLNDNRAMREIMALADLANQYIDHHQPWALAKEVGREHDVQLICTQGLNLFRLLAIYLKPVLPMMAEHIEQFFNVKPFSWQDSQRPLLNHSINQFQPLMQRIAPEDARAMTTH